MTKDQRSRVAEVAGVFLRLGFTAFGGPAVHVALMEDEVVKRRNWLSRQEFLDIVGALNFIPGPNSTELAIHLGMIRAGWRGLIVAGVCFILPAMLIILPIAWLYVQASAMGADHKPPSSVVGPLLGIRAAVIAVIAVAMWRFARTGVKDRFGAVVAVLAVVAGFLAQMDRFRVPQAELIILALAAAAGAMWYRRGSAASAAGGMVPLPLLAQGAPVAVGAGAVGVSMWVGLGKMFLFFLKIGATLFGSGYVLVSYLHGGLVEDHRWLTADQLTDAVAVGQVTPGPLLTTATFIGFFLGHRWGGNTGALLGAVLATVAIFLPSFLFIAALGPFWSRLTQSPLARGALDGMNAAVVALILVVAASLAWSTFAPLPAMTRAWAGPVALVSLGLLLIWNINSTWIIAGAAAVGWICTRFG